MKDDSVTREEYVNKSRPEQSGSEFENKVSGFLRDNHNFQLLTRKELQEIKLSHGIFPDRYVILKDKYENIIGKIMRESNLPRKQKRGRPRGCGETEFVIVADNAKSTKEFPLKEGEQLRVRVECRYQKSGGSTKDKNMYCIHNLQQCSPDYNNIFLMDGPAFDEADYIYAERCCKGIVLFCEKGLEQQNKVTPMRMSDFFSWTKEAFS